MPACRTITLVAVSLAALSFSIAPQRAVAAEVAHLTLQSEPGDWVGQGKTFDVTYQTPGPHTIDAQVRKFLPSGPAELLFVLDQNTVAMNTYALLFFGTDQLGIRMQPGTYLDAQRADFADPGHPGLDISWQNRGSNDLTGSFTVTEATFQGAKIASFSANFEQYCEGLRSPLRGTFTYRNLALPQPVPEPGSLMLVGSSVIGLLLRRRALR